MSLGRGIAEQQQATPPPPPLPLVYDISSDVAEEALTAAELEFFPDAVTFFGDRSRYWLASALGFGRRCGAS